MRIISASTASAFSTVYREEKADVQTRPDLTLPVPLGERSVPGGRVLLTGLVLALCGYGTWYYVATGERERPERVAAVPAELQQLTAPAAIGPGAADSGRPDRDISSPGLCVQAGAPAAGRGDGQLRCARSASGAARRGRRKLGSDGCGAATRLGRAAAAAIGGRSGRAGRRRRRACSPPAPTAATE